MSVHVLCRTPADHPHHFWDRTTKRLHPFPFVEAADAFAAVDATTEGLVHAALCYA